MIVYVVTADGWNEGYGAEIYLVGVFSTMEKAEQVAKDNSGIVTEIMLDEEHKMAESDTLFYRAGNDKYLGGYVE